MLTVDRQIKCIGRTERRSHHGIEGITDKFAIAIAIELYIIYKREFNIIKNTTIFTYW
jgi:hypothetical protein